ncbi:velvet factor-domain-containing protein [Lipomyces tetrasporus]
MCRTYAGATGPGLCGKSQVRLDYSKNTNCNYTLSSTQLSNIFHPFVFALQLLLSVRALALALAHIHGARLSAAIVASPLNLSAALPLIDRIRSARRLADDGISKLALLVRPPASILRTLATVSSAAGPGSDRGGGESSCLSSYDSYEDEDADEDESASDFDQSDDFNASDHPIPGRSTKRKRPRRHKRRSLSSDSDVSRRKTDRSKTAIASLIDPPETQSPAPSLSSTASVRVPISALRRGLRVEDYMLEIRQQPIRCKAAGTSGRALADRKAVDPPPIIQLAVSDGDPHREWLQSPFFFMCANLYDPVVNTPVARPPSETLAGTLVSSLHRVRDENDREGGYFVFGDLSVKLDGQFRLQFNLFEMLDGAQVEFITSTVSDIFTVYSGRHFPGVLESTSLSRQFSDQGVRLRLRKETGGRAGASPATTTTAARSESSTTEVSTPSSTATAATALTISTAPSPSAKRPSESPVRTSRKRSSPRTSICSTSSSASSSTVSLPSSNRQTRSDEPADTEDHKNYYYDRSQQQPAQPSSYSPRQGGQIYYMPAPPPPPPPRPQSTTIPQGHVHRQQTQSPPQMALPPFYSAQPQYPPHLPPKSEPAHAGFEPQPFEQLAGVNHSATPAPHHPQPPYDFPPLPSLPAPLSGIAQPRPSPPAVLHPSLVPKGPPPLTGLAGPMGDSDGRWRLPPLIFGDPGASRTESPLPLSLPPQEELVLTASTGTNGPYIPIPRPPPSFDSASSHYDGNYYN